jgi:hypothetical protein
VVLWMKDGEFQLDFSNLRWKKFHHVNYNCTLYPYMVTPGWCSHSHVICAFIHQFLFADQFVHCLSATDLICRSAMSKKWKNMLSNLNEQALFGKGVVAVHVVCLFAAVWCMFVSGADATCCDENLFYVIYICSKVVCVMILSCITCFT